MNTRNYGDVKILLVEDDDIDAMGIERAMRKMGLNNQLVRVRDGIEGLELLRSGTIQQPFLMLLDLRMPRMGGLEMLSHIRADEQIQDTIAFVLTTSRSEDEIASAYSKHVAGYIVKSSLSQDMNKLLDFLKTYLQVIEFKR